MNPKDEIQKLREEILRCNKAYYDEDAPIISDAAYDTLTQRLRQLEEEHPELASSSSPTQQVGGHAMFGAVHHTVPLLSLKDIFNTDDVLSWYRDACAQAGRLLACTIEDKVDGLSCALTYKGGNLVSAATRGDGRTGEDVTPNVMAMMGIPHHLPFARIDSTIIVRCEICMPIKTFEDLNRRRESEGKSLFKNPRNAAAGSLRVSDPKITSSRGLRAIAFAVLYAENQPQLRQSQNQDLTWLYDNGFDVVNWYCCDGSNRLLLNRNIPSAFFGDTIPEEQRFLEQIQTGISQIDSCRHVRMYAIDGAVIKLDDMKLYDQFGETDKYPRWAMAYKYPPEQKETTLLDIQLQTGRTGVITPVAVFDPVQLAGTTVTRATLHNQDFMDTVLGGVAIGDTIVVHKSGEIIPEVLKVLHDKRPAGAQDFKITTCPVCGAKAVLGADENGNGTQMFCTNPDCPAILEGRLIYWCSKHIMDIDGIGPKVIRALLRFGLTSIEGLYEISEDELASIKEIGSVRAAKLFPAIQHSRNANIDRLIAGLGIPGVGRHIGAILAEKYPDMQSIKTAALHDELTAIDGIGDITANDIKAFFTDPARMSFLDNMAALGFNMKSLTFQPANQASSGNKPLTGLTFVITGSFPTMSRTDMKAYLESLGAKVSSSVSKKTSYLLAGEGGGSKRDKADELHVPVLTAEQLDALVKGADPA